MQKPSFVDVCPNYVEDPRYSAAREEEENEGVELINDKIDYSKIIWSELEPIKEVYSTPNKNDISYSVRRLHYMADPSILIWWGPLVQRIGYLKSEIIAVPKEGVKSWGLDKVPDVDLSKQMKLIVKNRALYQYVKGALVFGVGVFILFMLISIKLALLLWVGMVLGGFILDRIYTCPKYVFFEINRLDGLMKLPNHRKKQRHIVLFKDVYFHLVGKGAGNRHLLSNLGMVMPKELMINVNSVPFFEDHYNDKVIEALSICVWYMDKNRPLPLGAEFDKFRQKDFERRKAEGFPPPMYLSHIPTPEATAEQQAEREAYWKDEDYKVTDMSTKNTLMKWYSIFNLSVDYSHLQSGITHKSYLGGMLTVRDNSKKTDKQ
jgi:hypothetical protein